MDEIHYQTTNRVHQRMEIQKYNGNQDDMNFEIPQTPTALASFDADKFLFENFTKRGRAIKRNRKHALAWKIYNDSTTQADSLTKTEIKKRIPKDTLAIACDTLK